MDVVLYLRASVVDLLEEVNAALAVVKLVWEMPPRKVSCDSILHAQG